MVVCNSFDIYIFILSSTARWCQYLINSAFLSFFWGCQKSVLIATLKTPFGSISFNSWLRCYGIVRWMAPLPSGRTAAIENEGAAISFSLVRIGAVNSLQSTDTVCWLERGYPTCETTFFIYWQRFIVWTHCNPVRSVGDWRGGREAG